MNPENEIIGKVRRILQDEGVGYLHKVYWDRIPAGNPELSVCSHCQKCSARRNGYHDRSDSADFQHCKSSIHRLPDSIDKLWQWRWAAAAACPDIHDRYIVYGTIGKGSKLLYRSQLSLKENHEFADEIPLSFRDSICSSRSGQGK